jgi:ABC-type branched-subunit amino acid transport system ATPase component
MAKAVLARLRGVKKRYGQTVALDGLDLEVRAGELLAVLGPNGAGKTTAIGLLLGCSGPTPARRPCSAARRSTSPPGAAWASWARWRRWRR